MSEREQEIDDGGRAGTPVEPLRIWNAIRVRWTWIFVAGVIGAFIGAAVAKKFIAQTFAAQAVVAYQGDVSPQSPERQTIFESLTLNSNLAETAKRLQLPLPASTMRAFINVAGNDRTNIITVDGSWATPDGAANLVNTLIDVFLESRQRVVKERLDGEVERLRGAVTQAESKYNLASKAYDEFRRAEGITDISQERELAIKEAAELAVQADSAKADAAAARSVLDGIKTVPTMPASSTTSEAESRQADLDEKRLLDARRELDVAKIQYSGDHPMVRRLAAEVSTLETRVKGRYSDKENLSARRYAHAQQQANSAANRQRVAEEYRTRLKARLNKLSAAEGQAAVLLGELKVADEALERAKQMLAGVELQVHRPSAEFQVLERAVAPQYALASSRRKAALGFPLGFALAATVLSLLVAFRKLEVRTPSEAAYWAKLPVIGASTWPRDPEMLSSLMHDLDDYAPHCEGVTLIVGVSIEEAHLARRVAEWEGHRMPKIHDVNRLLASGAPLAVADERVGGGGVDTGLPAGDVAPPVMQILTLTGPVPAQALRRAARLADRVLVVVNAGRHDIFQLMKIRSRLGRDAGIGLLFVGLDKEYAMVRDRVGPIESFWYATRAVGSRAEA